MTVFEKKMDEVSEIDPGSIIVIRANGEVIKERFAEDPARRTSCSFERIYFSRGNDPDIYAERKTLGALLVPQVLEVVGKDFSKSVFSYVPNTAESAYYGFMEQLRLVRRAEVNASERLGERRVGPRHVPWRVQRPPSHARLFGVGLCAQERAAPRV